MSTIPLDVQRRCEQRWAARFARQGQKVGLNTGSQGRRVDEKPTLASQGIGKNPSPARRERCERGAVVRRQECF
jgi:hypothetical protein